MYREINLFQFINIFPFIGYFISISASGSHVTVSVGQREVSGTVNQSVLLPVSYSTLTPYTTVKIKWFLFPGDTPLVTLTRFNCSADPDRSGYTCSDNQLVTPSHKERVHIYPENGSLLLWDLQLSDSGVYVISVYCGGNTTIEGNVTLTVYPGTGRTQKNTTTSDNGMKAMYFSVPAAVCLLILTIYLCLLATKRFRGCHARHDSVASEASVQPIEVTRQELAEVRESVTNGELTYSLLQWSKPRNSAPEPDTREGPLETIYAFAQKTAR